MRFDAVVGAPGRRLPEPLPAPADVLMPVVLGSADPERRTRASRPGREPRPRRRPRPALPRRRRRRPGRAHRADRRTTAITRARSASRAARPSPTTRTPRRPRCARRPRRSASTRTRPASASSGGSTRFWIPVSDFEVTPDRRPRRAGAGLRRRDRRGRPHPRATAGAASCPDAPIEIVERTIGDWPLRYGALRGRRPVGLGRHGPRPEPARAAVLDRR